ncbi:hypothetical protein [Dokdonella koreensis]|uniref:Uncharacterized protein n=1 Tax=Dokdonella koreensis DS-123 TaxID=1300342 RepID=A0A160DWA8_9GAMM|nr:hypothetical protein [Dokdonella koreensis]ANB18704.1 Hypothetical protein I596_2709 [Dokdonella koreensis DS-123]
MPSSIPAFLRPSWLLTLLLGPACALAAEPQALPLAAAPALEAGTAPAKAAAPLAVPPPQLAGTVATLEADGTVAIQCRDIPNLDARPTFLERAERRRAQAAAEQSE